MTLQESLEEKQVDLDAMLKGFSTWQKHVGKMSRENEHRLDENQLLSKQLTAIRHREVITSKELCETRGIIDDLHNTLATRCDFEDKNKVLEKEISKLADDVASVKKEYEGKIEDMTKCTEELKVSHKIEMNQLKSTLNANEEMQKNTLRQQLAESRRQVETLERHLVDEEKERQADLVRVRLQWDSKLLRMQKQSTKSQQNAAVMSSANQDIFRKKLQHAKAESDGEIARLNGQLKEMQHRLAQNTNVVPFKRKRF